MAGRLTYRHIEAIRAVMLTGSVTGAAASLHVTQPAISHLMRDVDLLLQFPLFDRQAGRLIPTERAALLLDEIERSFVGLDSINDVGARLRIARQRTVTVVVLPVVATALLPTMIDGYRALESQHFFQIDAVNNEQVLGQVIAGKADLGIALETTHVPGMSCRLLKEFAARCLLPPSHPLAGREIVRAADLGGLPMISVPRADRLIDPVADVFEGVPCPPVRVVECASATAACAMVEAGIGFALLDPIACAPFQNSRIWFARFEPRISFRFCAYWLDGRDVRFDRAALLDLAAQQCEDLDRHCVSPGLIHLANPAETGHSRLRVAKGRKVDRG